MIYAIKFRSEEDKPVIHFLNLAILLFLFRTTIPVFKYPFILSYSALLIFSVYNYRKELFNGLITFLKGYYLPLILLLITTLAFLFSIKFYLIIFKDLVNTFILFSFFFLLHLIVSTSDDVKIFFRSIVSQLVLFGLVISIYELGVLMSIIHVDNYAYFPGTKSLSNNYLEIDNNFGMLPVIFGLTGLFYFKLKEHSRAKWILFDFLSVLLAISIFFSGSRRGIVALGVIVITVIIIEMLRFFFRRNEFFRGVRPGFLISALSVSLVLISFGTFTSYSFKNKALIFLGSRNITIAKQNIAAVLFKYKSGFDNRKTYLDYYYETWQVVPEDPDSGWGYRKHDTVFPLKGENVGIVPHDSRGYYQDSTCDYSSWSGNAYAFTQVGSKYVVEGSVLDASVYCYVSESFNGEWVSFSAEGSINENGDRFYDLEKKGTWQKLDLNLQCSDGNVSLFLYFSKYGVKDFGSLNGYVVFAYPRVSILTGSKSAGDIPGVGTHSLYSAYFPEKRPFAGPIPEPESLSTMSLLPETGIITGVDPIRDWAARFVREDTVYYGLKNEILVNSHLNNTSDQRLIRWRFALQIFLREYNWKQKIFGEGFIHLNWYGYYFLKDKTTSDWPHNPFLSILLYSGFLGFSLFCFFMYKVFYYYIKYTKEYPLLFIFFITTFFFSFFSGGSPFDPPVMGFFSILPFFINSVYKKSDKVSNTSK